jgi:mono/diheme cytochrome c family protein
VLFAEKIAPLFKRNCNSCHGDPLIKGGLDTRTLASIAKGGDNGKAVVAKDPDKSYLWMQVESGAMPPAGKEKLTPAEIKLIKDWILSGAK